MKQTWQASSDNWSLQREVPLEQARNSLSKLADAAHGGERITLTKHGRPWAHLTSVAPAQDHRRQAGRWALAGVDLDPYALFAPEHRSTLVQRIARQTASHPWGSEPAGLGSDLAGRRLLLDTHVLQWWWCSPGLLSPLARYLLKDPAMPLWLSTQSLMELSALARSSQNQALQAALARVQLDLEDENLTLLPVQPQHLQRACRRPWAALDLHDAVLLAQSNAEAMSLISADPALQSAELTPLW